MRRLEPLVVLLGYAAASVTLLGRFWLAQPRDAVVGSYGADQGFFAWSLVHWVEVVASGQAPFMTDRIDAPGGFNLAWATTIPAPALLLAPLTAAAGPLVSYNLLALAAPALAAWTAYLLCRHLTGDPIAAVLGGWAFGFSSYMLGETLNHVNLALVWTLPLVVLVVVRLVEGSLRPRWAALALAGLSGVQLLTFSEVAATATLVGALALLLALALGPPGTRRRIVAALPWIGLGCAGGAVLAAPLLIAAFRHSNPIVERIRPDLYPLDLANLWTPTRITWLGGERFAAESARLAGNLTEQLGYVGPLLLAVAVAGAIRWRHVRWVWLVVLATLVAVVLALGAHLTRSGSPGTTLPWQAVMHLPLVHLALPARVVVFAWLGIAVLVALFAARVGGERPLHAGARIAIAVLALATLLPAPDAQLWRTPLVTPSGIASQTATRAIPDDAVVLVLPYAFRGNGMYWQALSGMRWRMAGGYSAAAIPAQYAGLPVVYGFYQDRLPDDARQELLRYLAFTGATWVLVDARFPGPWPEVLRAAGGTESIVGGVMRYRFDPAQVRAQVDGA